MQLLSALVLSALAFGVKAGPQRITPSIDPTLTFTTRPTLTFDPTITLTPTPSPNPEQCICPGKLLCCRGLYDSADPPAVSALSALGVHIDGTSVPVGLACTPYDPRQLQCREPVCCFDSRKPEIAAIGCVKVPPPRPTLTTIPPTFTTVTPTFTTVNPTLTFIPVDPTYTIGPVRPSLV